MRMNDISNENTKIMLQNLENFIMEYINAIQTLVLQKDIKFIPVTVLIYTLIDNLSYLEYGEPNKKLNLRNRYTDWCKKYVLKNLEGNNSKLNEFDFWYARCGVIHNGIATSLHKDSKSYFYADHDKKFPKAPEFKNMVVINVYSLTQSIHSSIIDCLKSNEKSVNNDFYNRSQNLISKKMHSNHK